MSSAQNTIPTDSVSGTFVTQEQVAELVQSNQLLQQQVEALTAQVAWFKQQIFGSKSERRIEQDDTLQLNLFADLEPTTEPEVPVKVVAQHKRRVRFKDETNEEPALFFDEDRVPVEVIELPNPEIKGLAPEDYEVIGHKTTHKLAQRPGSYVILKYIRPVIKVRHTQAIHCPPAPGGVLDKSRADVSFIAGLLIDKIAWHLPLYRQQQRMTAAGIKVSRGWLTNLCAKASELLSPIYAAQLKSISQSHVITMDETHIKAGREAPQKMRSGFFWPIYGDQDEICFEYFGNRNHENVEAVLGRGSRSGSVMLSDGYGAYATYAASTGMTHAQCWAHCRREFIKAEEIEPDLVATALSYIRALYAVEERIAKEDLQGQQKLDFRIEHAQPVVKAFFKWVDECLSDVTLLPSSPFAKALGYTHPRKTSLSVFLTDAAVPLDTNHIERAIRPIAIGRKNWMFAWTELGAKHIGIMQSLISTCRLHGIDPYTYLVDVLQRVSMQPDSQVHTLIPRLWKQHFADQPLTSQVTIV